MEISNREVSYSRFFRITLISVLEYIAEDSLSNAEKFKDDLLIFLDEIKKYPDIYKEFGAWKTKSKFYRYRLFKKRYFVIFKVTKLKLVFVRIEYAKRNPDYYKALKKQ